jgi:hypothetical protein
MSGSNKGHDWYIERIVISISDLDYQVYHWKCKKCQLVDLRRNADRPPALIGDTDFDCQKRIMERALV